MRRPKARAGVDERTPRGRLFQNVSMARSATACRFDGRAHEVPARTILLKYSRRSAAPVAIRQRTREHRFKFNDRSVGLPPKSQDGARFMFITEQSQTVAAEEGRVGSVTTCVRRTTECRVGSYGTFSDSGSRTPDVARTSLTITPISSDWTASRAAFFLISSRSAAPWARWRAA